jgi:hypothetical protein
LKRAEDEYALVTTTTLRANVTCATQSPDRCAEVGTLKKFSFLIGATDPFIVVPGAFAHGQDRIKPRDCAVVVFGDAIYPVIVGDVETNDKVAELAAR